MSDGKLIFDTKIDKTGIRKDLPSVKKEIESSLSRAGDGFARTGAKLTNYITKPALVAGAAVAGIVVKKGWDRLTAIDDARAKLEGLGHSAKAVDGIMDSALASVKGTAFGLGEAASTAATAVASGIKPGKELTRYLSLVGDAAAIAGTDMNEMGMVFGKVAANGKLSAEELNMLTDRGIPALSLLAKASGKTVEQVRKDMAAGKISTEDFLNAIELGMGGAAKIMGSKSLRAAMANIGASLGRIGANFLDAGGKGGGAFSQLKPLLADLAGWLEKIEEKSVKWGESFGKVFSAITKGFIAMPNGFAAAVAGLAIGAGPMLKLTGATLKGMDALRKFRSSAKGASLMTGVLKGEITASQTILGKFGGGIATVGKGITTHGKALAVSVAAHAKNTAATAIDMAANSGFGKVVGGIGGKVMGAAKSVLAFAAAHKIAMLAALGIVGAIVGVAVYMSKTGTSAAELAAKITDFADMAADAINAFAEAFPSMVDGLVTALVSVIDSIAQQLPAIISALTDALVAALPQIIDAGIVLFTGLVDALPVVITALVGALPMLIGTITQALIALMPALTQAGITLLMALVDAIPQIIPPLVDAIPQIVDAIVRMLITLTPVLIAAAVQLFMALVKALPQVIAAVIGALGQLRAVLASRLVGMLVGIWSMVKSGAASAWNGIKSAIAAKVQAIWSGIKAKANAILSVFSFKGLASRVSRAWSAAKAAMVKQMEVAKSKLTGIVKKIKNIFAKVVLKLKIKIPRVTVRGGSPPFGIGGKGHLPSFSVHWARLGGIVNKATLLGAGEAGAEVIMPLDKFWRKMDALALSIMSGMKTISESIKQRMPFEGSGPQPYAAQSINKMRDLEQARLISSGSSVDAAIDKFADALANVKVTHIWTCDERVLATVTAPHMGPELKKINRRQSRKLGHV